MFHSRNMLPGLIVLVAKKKITNRGYHSRTLCNKKYKLVVFTDVVVINWSMYHMQIRNLLQLWLQLLCGSIRFGLNKNMSDYCINKAV